MLEPLPIDAALDDIQAALRLSQALVIVAAPGAGKTTRVPPALLDRGPAIVLQPRRTAARAIARRIASEQQWTVGREVGWHVRLDRNFNRDTRLLIATEGILTARLQHDPLLSDFTTIVLDEFHERSIHADIAIALSKQALLARSDLRLVIMSATLDAGRVTAYLNDCPLIEVPGRLHPVTVRYEPALSTAESVARLLHDTEGNVLCFQPGAAEIRKTITELQASQPASIDILPLHGSLTADEQDRVLSTTWSRRRIIVATNIAETSVTVPGVTGVVDSGYEKVARYDSERAIDSLRRERITQAAADQRAGRAGRLAPGIVYRLWESTDRLRPHREPDIQRVDLCGIALDVLAWGTDPRTLDWFEAPRPESLEQALRLLERIGAVSGLHLTDIGRVMQRLAVPPRLARILVEGCGERAIVRAVATIAERHYLPPRPESSASDLFFVLDHWDIVPEHIRRVASDLEASLRHEISAPVAGPGVEARLCRAVLAGYPDRIAQRREPASSRFLLATGTGAILSRESAVRDAEFVVALDVRTVDDAYATESRITLASAVERDWLAPTGTDVEYTVDDRGFVRAREIERYDALRLAERPIAPDTERAADVLATAYLERPLSDADRRLIRRAEFAGCHIELAALVRAAAYGVRSLAEIDITRVLPRDVADTIARNAPLTLALPSGRRAALEYGEDGTMSAEVKLQELFGLAETPRVGPRREPVLLSLLAPNGRPVQVTRDLRSFWDRTYPEVRKELRGRYPKHPWPEDPWNAVPTHRTKPRSQS